MKTVSRYLLFVLLVFLISFVVPQEKGKFGAAIGKKSQLSNYSMLNINDLAIWLRDDGASANSPSANSGGLYPQREIGVIYQDGIMWGGIIDDPTPTIPKLRVGGATYLVGTVAGYIATPGNNGQPPIASAEVTRIWRIRKDWQNLSVSDPEIIEDAAKLNEVDTSQVTIAMAQAVLDQYQMDWNDWPLALGAPFDDLNSNGVYDPGTDIPGIAGADQVVWTVVHDLDTANAVGLYGSHPLGLEVQITLWGYNSLPNANSTAFRRYRIINKSGYTIDSMFVAQWSDPDIGNFIDDFAGCDESLKAGYAYNGTPEDNTFQSFGLVPAAVGYSLMQGPQSTATVLSNQPKLQSTDLGMTSFSFWAAGSPISDPTLGDYEGTIQWYNVMNGLRPDPFSPGSPYVHGCGPNLGMPTLFPLNGNPVTMSGDVDGCQNNLPAGDRRFSINSGPFQMPPNTSQDIVMAISAGIGTNYLQSIDVVKNKLSAAQAIFDGLVFTGIEDEPVARRYQLAQNYPNPFNPQTTIVFALPKTGTAKLEIFNVLGQRVKTLVNHSMSAGEYTLTWDGRADSGYQVASGIYFYRLTAGDFVQSRKMMLIR